MQTFALNAKEPKSTTSFQLPAGDMNPCNTKSSLHPGNLIWIQQVRALRRYEYVLSNVMAIFSSNYRGVNLLAIGLISQIFTDLCSETTGIDLPLYFMFTDAYSWHITS